MMRTKHRVRRSPSLYRKERNQHDASGCSVGDHELMHEEDTSWEDEEEANEASDLELHQIVQRTF
jgi:hypothetical protein